MKRVFNISLFVLALLLVAALFMVNSLTDLRTKDLKGGISPTQLAEGKKLLEEMQEAYGGKEYWLAKGKGSYEQIAEWYGNTLVAGWDTIPQHFNMTSTLGTDNCFMTLLNGPTRGEIWGVEEDKTYSLQAYEEKKFVQNKQAHHKLIYKNYWFQFPFRIDEAPIIAYAGEGTVEGKIYDLLFVTWKTEAPNADYDQCILYIDKETRHIEWLHFTVREIFTFISFTAHFTDIKEVEGILHPFSMYVSIGQPDKKIAKLHENHYQRIWYNH
ncbi:MAG: hypothetical protein AAFY71_17050 [Bacteroidota bacterium]